MVSDYHIGLCSSLTYVHAPAKGQEATSTAKSANPATQPTCCSNMQNDWKKGQFSSAASTRISAMETRSPGWHCWPFLLHFLTRFPKLTTQPILALGFSYWLLRNLTPGQEMSPPAFNEWLFPGSRAPEAWGSPRVWWMSTRCGGGPEPATDFQKGPWLKHWLRTLRGRKNSGAWQS